MDNVLLRMTKNLMVVMFLRAILLQSALSFTINGWSPSRQSANICFNGGIMVLGSFCICPDEYGGQYCEEEQKSCGSVPHDETINMGCNACLCRNGKFYCIPRGLRDCFRDISDDVVKVVTFPPLTTIEPTTTTRKSDDYYYSSQPPVLWF
ncbi:teratocarcinoma-derived growth factor-like [Glandiceps talaboti]